MATGYHPIGRPYSFASLTFASFAFYTFNYIKQGFNCQGFRSKNLFLYIKTADNPHFLTVFENLTCNNKVEIYG